LKEFIFLQRIFDQRAFHGVNSPEFTLGPDCNRIDASESLTWKKKKRKLNEKPKIKTFESSHKASYIYAEVQSSIAKNQIVGHLNMKNIFCHFIDCRG